jgi:hypothetical protein
MRVTAAKGRELREQGTTTVQPRRGYVGMLDPFLVQLAIDRLLAEVTARLTGPISCLAAVTARKSRVVRGRVER